MRWSRGRRRLDEGRALVTVAATVVGGSASTRYLTVPVARDARGGLVVYDLPSFSAPPARGQVAPGIRSRCRGRTRPRCRTC